MKYFKTKNVHEKLKLLIKFYKNKNTALYINLRFANQAGIIRWLKLQIKQLYLKNLLIFERTAKSIQ